MFLISTYDLTCPSRKTRFKLIDGVGRRNNGSGPLDQAGTGRVLPKQIVNPHFIIIGAVFRKYSS